jgi:hypothetical protein
VSAEDERVDVTHRDSKLLGDKRAVAGGVEDARHPDYPLAREAAYVHRDVAHRVERVRDHHQDRLRRVLDHLFGYAPDDVLVGLEEVVAAHPRFAGTPAGYHDHVRARALLVAVSADHVRVEADHGSALQDVQSLALRQALDYVHEDHVCVVALRQPLGRRPADVAGAHDRNLALCHGNSLLYVPRCAAP